jgi:hypothetical protein
MSARPGPSGGYHVSGIPTGIALTTPERFLVHSQYVHPKHPPDKEYRDDGPRDVNYPVARCFRFPKIEHAAMVAGPCADGLTSPLHSLTGTANFQYV